MNKINKTIIIVLMILLAVTVFMILTNTKVYAPAESSNETNSEIEEDVGAGLAPPVEAQDIYEEPIEKLASGLPIVMYHFFYDASAGETGADGNWMEISAFEAQMKYLNENNYYYPSWNEVADYVAGNRALPSKSVVISIDDGDPSFFKLAVPVLKKYNVTATSFIITSWYGHQVLEHKSPILNFESHTNDMHKSGSDGKGAFTTVSYENALNDINTAASICGSNIAFCYPFGHYNDHCIQVLKDAGYKVAVTTEDGRVYPGIDPYKLPRVRTNKGMSLDSFISLVK